MRELILNLHGLGDPHPSTAAEEKRYWWSKSAFVRLLDQIADRPANAVPRISLTFDDGNASDYLLALPELADRRLTASFFVCAGRIGQPYYLDGPMINELIDAGMTVGSHGMYHQDWRGLDAAQLDVEIGGARRKLEDVTQKNVDNVAIPFGSYDRGVLRRLNREYWDCIYTSDRGTAQSTWRMKPRETLEAGMQGRNVLAELAASLSPQVCLGRAIMRLYKRLR